MMESTYNRGRILDRNSSHSIPDNFEERTEEESDEVVGLVLDERLVELDDRWYKIEDRSNNSKCEAGIIEPDVVGVFFPVFGHGSVTICELEIRGRRAGKMLG